MNPYIKYIIATAIAASAALTPANAGQLKITVDSARHVVIIPAVEGGADVAVAIVDGRIGSPDTTVTIASQLLMQNDLHGHVEDAAWYLRTPRREAGPAADALMLTQGWTRYDMPAAIRGEINDSLPFPLEIGAQLDGVIRSKWRGKPLAGVTANVLAPRMADGASAVTDSLGRFHITGIEWADSTFFVISAMNSKGKLEENIHPDFDSFPTIAILPESQSIAESFAALDEDPDRWDNYVARLNSSPQGMQISLKEVVVRATKKREGANAIDYLASVYIRPDNDKDIRSYEEAVTHIPGVNVINDRLMYHQTPVSVWVDGRYLGSADEQSRIRKSGASLRARKTSYTSLQTYGIGGASPANLDESINYNANSYSATNLYDIGLFTNNLKLIDLENMYPFADNESVAYIPPHLSVLFKHGTNTNGGVLNIKTKHPGKISNTLSPEFRTISPLGYQRRKKFYTPAYSPEGIPEEQTGATLRWLPKVDLTQSIELPIPANISPSEITVSVEGLTPQGSMVSITH
ncbi:hypothetical protein [Muribaculum sp.]|uniref:hypothetical protein n=1 Tax=Muribaculum sp. TaxID=1918611 RepID=UPI0026063DEA|nr:hypothetical protein [Muribaculum sp.]